MEKAESEIWQNYQNAPISLLARMGKRVVFGEVANVAVLGFWIYT